MQHLSSVVIVIAVLLLSSLTISLNGRVLMGRVNSNCDDAKTNLTLDWDESFVNYTCYTPKNHLRLIELNPILQCEFIPPGYLPQHFCMNEKIIYSNPLPTHADHRPLWARFGEYLFLPPQRWSHNIEHGAVVMLYHPCANPESVKRLKKIVKSCIWKHVITASNQVPLERPFVLIAWGCRLLMSNVYESLVEDFIRTRALQGPEGRYSKDGQYDFLLTQPAKVPKGSNRDDNRLCPHLK